MRETTKQNLSILAITLLLVVSAYIFLNFIKPGLAQRKELLVQIQEAQAKIQMLKDYQAKFNNLAQNYQNLGAEIEMINQALPQEAQTAQILATLDAISKQTGISLNNLSFTIQAGENYNTVNIKTDFNATYTAFKAWLNEIEKELRLFDLEKVNIKASVAPSLTSSKKTTTKAASSLLQFSVDLVTYYQD